MVVSQRVSSAVRFARLSAPGPVLPLHRRLEALPPPTDLSWAMRGLKISCLLDLPPACLMLVAILASCFQKFFTRPFSIFMYSTALVRHSGFMHDSLPLFLLLFSALFLFFLSFFSFFSCFFSFFASFLCFFLSFFFSFLSLFFLSFFLSSFLAFLLAFFFRSLLFLLFLFFLDFLDFFLSFLFFLTFLSFLFFFTFLSFLFFLTFLSFLFFFFPLLAFLSFFFFNFLFLFLGSASLIALDSAISESPCSSLPCGAPLVRATKAAKNKPKRRSLFMMVL